MRGFWLETECQMSWQKCVDCHLVTGQLVDLSKEYLTLIIDTSTDIMKISHKLPFNSFVLLTEVLWRYCIMYISMNISHHYFIVYFILIDYRMKLAVSRNPIVIVYIVLKPHYVKRSSKTLVWIEFKLKRNGQFIILKTACWLEIQNHEHFSDLKNAVYLFYVMFLMPLMVTNIM